MVKVRVHPEESLVGRVHRQSPGIEDLLQLEVKAVAAVHVGPLYARVVARTRVAQVSKEEVPARLFIYLLKKKIENRDDG